MAVLAVRVPPSQRRGRMPTRFRQYCLLPAFTTRCILIRFSRLHPSCSRRSQSTRAAKLGTVSDAGGLTLLCCIVTELGTLCGAGSNESLLLLSSSSSAQHSLISAVCCIFSLHPNTADSATVLNRDSRV